MPYLLKRRRITLPVPVAEWLRDALSPAGIESLPVSWEIAFRSTQLPEHHRDPADRISIANTLAYDARLASLDSAFPNDEELAGRLIGA